MEKLRIVQTEPAPSGQIIQSLLQKQQNRIKNVHYMTENYQ